MSSIVRVTFPNVSNARSVFQAIKALVTDIQFSIVNHIDFTGIKVTTLDSNHVCVLYVNLEAEVENLASGESVTLCVDSKILSTAIKQVKEHNTMMFEYDPNKSGEHFLHVHQFQVRGGAAGKVTDICVKDAPEQDELETDFDYPFVINLEMKELRCIVSEATDFGSDMLTFVLNKARVSPTNIHNYLEIVTSGVVTNRNFYYTQHCSDTNSASMEIDDSISIETKPDDLSFTKVMKCSISIKYIKDFIAALGSQKITLSIDNEMPLRLDYTIDEVSYITLFVTLKTEE